MENTQTTDYSDSGNAKESTVIDNAKLKHDLNPDRPLSPVLASRGLQRKLCNVRNKRDKHKSRVNLTNKFNNDNNIVKQTESTNTIAIIASDLQVLEPDKVEERLKKIKEYENERRKYTDRLYIQEQPQKSFVRECKPQTQADISDFDFKIPISPVPSAKRPAKFNSPIRNITNTPLKPPQVKCSGKFEGFRTGTGRTITISINNMDKYAKLFEDILNTTELSQEDPLKRQNINKDDLSNGLETSITDTQMILAADNAVAALEDLKNSKQDEVLNVSVNFCSGNAPIEGESPSFGRQTTKMTQHLMELKRILAENPSSDDDDDEELEDSEFPVEIILRDNLRGFQKSEVVLAEKQFANFRQFVNDLLKSSETPTRGVKHNLIQETNQGANKKFKPDPEVNHQGFVTASGKALKVEQEWLEKVSRMFDNLPELDEKLKARQAPIKPVGFSTASGRNIKISDQALHKAKLIFHDDNDQNDEEMQNDEKVPESQGPKANEELKGFSKANGDSIKTSESALKTAIQQVFADEKDLNLVPSGTEQVIVKDKPKENRTGLSENSIQGTKKRTLNVSAGRKRLGISSCKKISIPHDKLERAKQILEQELSFEPNPFATPKKFDLSGTIYSSTPLRELNAPKDVTTPAITRLKPEKSFADINITPIKKNSTTSQPEDPRLFLNKQTKQAFDYFSPVLLLSDQNKTGNPQKWLEDLNEEYKKLELKLKILAERKLALEEQQSLTENVDHERRRQRVGVLLAKKRASQKVSLKQFVNSCEPGDNATPANIPHHLLDITPKTAEYVHFNCLIGENQESVIRTLDGAVLIPNTKTLVGLAEIKAAFTVMPGVDPKLLPRGWISNHFKWIVWKLAGLSRSFPDKFANCFSLENVIQQLKYRYDREIDKAERSALRRILEKDDIAQKRMVLCVSDVIKVSDGGVYQLELTDGWYSVRTVIDSALIRQIEASKITVGTKLIVQCAEILNCDGCHPLEVPDHVQLKINYNCTRRVAWYSKLGYQHPTEPFPIRLSTIRSDGGLVGCIKVHVARVYPVRYMEKQDEIKSETNLVWRNEKAEEKRAREWQNQRMKQIETIQHRVEQDFQMELRNNQKTNNANQPDKSKISETTSGKSLYEMMEAANDVETFTNSLSSNQLRSLMDHKSRVHAQKQQELSNKVAEEMRSLKCSARNVVSVLKLKIVDVNENSSEKGYGLSVWNPTEEHLQILREGCTVVVYNVVSKRHEELATSSRTHFKIKQGSVSVNSKLKRHLTPVSMLQQKFFRPPFNEFDTVGTVVQIKKETHHQEVWLSDFIGRLLLIKINEGPDRCCLLDNFSRGQTVAVMNLVFCKPLEDFAQAFANQCSVITSYPQQEFLQDGLGSYKQQLPKDMTALLNECDKKIEACLTKVQLTRSSVGSSNLSNLMASATNNSSTNFDSVFDDSSEDVTTIPTRLTTTDVAMSLMDI